jgi:hypothetical protein
VVEPGIGPCPCSSSTPMSTTDLRRSGGYDNLEHELLDWIS